MSAYPRPSARSQRQQTPTHRTVSPSPAAAHGSMDDVNAFRLRPFSFASTVPAAAASRATAAASPQLPRLATNTGNAGNAQQGRTVAAGVAASNKIRSLHTPPSAPPHIYAALAPLRNASTEDCEWDETAATHPPPVPATTRIAAPDLTPAELRQLELWTRATATIGSPSRCLSGATSEHSRDALHQWWKERQAARLHSNHVAALSELLEPVLEQAVRALLTAEEHHWQEEIQEKLRKTGMRVGPSGGTPVPIQKMPNLLRALQVLLHETALSHITAQYTRAERESAATDAIADHEGCDGTPVKNVGRSIADVVELEKNEMAAAQALSLVHLREVLHAALQAEQGLAAESKRPPPTALSTGVSVVTLPPERFVPAPVLRLETAISVALLSSMIEQAETSTPGMELAAELLRRFVLPHIYPDFVGWSAVRPVLGTLSEQVMHLAALPLRVQQQRDMADAALQAQQDTSYLERVIKSWTMRAWLWRVTRQRQCVALQATMERVLDRLRSRLLLQRVVFAWRQEAQRGVQRSREAQMKMAYTNFLSHSQGAAPRNALPTIGTAAAMASALIMSSPSDAPCEKSVVTPDLQQPLQPAKRWPRSSKSTLTDLGEGISAVSSSRASIMASILVDRQAGAPSSPVTSQAPSSSSVLSRHRQNEGRQGKRKGTLHSRVNLTFMRNKTGSTFTDASGADANETGDTWPQQQKRGSTWEGQEERRKKSDAVVSTALERYSIRQHGSDEDEEEEEDSPEGFCNDGRSPSRLVFLESRPDDVAELHNESYLACAVSPVRGDASPDGRLTHLINAAAAGATVTEADAIENSLFQAMLAKLNEMDQVNTYLRSELAVQSRRLRKVETANKGLSQRNRELEESTLKLLRDKLEAVNVAQKQLATIREKNRRLRHLRSRLRAHRHRPWQSTVLRVIGDLCQVSTAAAEALDDARVHEDRYGTPGGSGSNGDDDDDGGSGSGETRRASCQGQREVHGTEDSEEMVKRGEGSAVSSLVTLFPQDRHSKPLDGVADAERLFGRIAPIVLCSVRQLPDALTILADWANSCLDDLEGLDDLKDGPLADRFQNFSEEARNGVLISRLLYYLALPRYHVTVSAAEAEHGTGQDIALSDPSGTRLDGLDRRRQLLEQRGVQLNPPFPVYADCFGDVLALPPVKRMIELLAFATELIAGKDIAAQQQEEEACLRNMLSGGGVTSAPNSVDEVSLGAEERSGATNAADPQWSLRSGIPALPILSASLPLHTVVDPYAITRGEASAVVTFIALLYVRFSHPFHHKSRLCARRERNALLQLWSGGQVTSAELSSYQDATLRSSLRGNSLKGSQPPHGYSIESDMLHQLPTEDKTVWQLFRECCLPVFGTQAHPFLLRGGFWPSEAFESPELAAMLSSLAMALRRSLELHRWHVVLSCLVPVRTYGGLSCGVFTGPNASANGLLLGLQQDGRAAVLIDHPLTHRCIQQRREAFAAAAAPELSAPVTPSPVEEISAHHLPLPAAADEIRTLAEMLSGAWHHDLLSLFVQRATLSVQLALPVLDLGGWRILCSDIGLINMASPDQENLARDDRAHSKRHSLRSTSARGVLRPREEDVDMEIITEVFQRAVMAVARDRGESDLAVLRSPSVTAHPSPEPRQPGRNTNARVTGAEHNDAGGVDDTLRRSRLTSQDSQTMPDIQMDMTYSAFVLALALLAHRLYAASAVLERDDSGGGADEEKQSAGDTASPRSAHAQPSYTLHYFSLPEAFSEMMQSNILPSSVAHLQPTDPKYILHHLTRGLRTQAALRSWSPALMLVYQAYSKEVFGEPGMLREDVLRLLRDAMLTSTELSQYLIYELFSSCAVLRQASEEVAVANRKEKDRQARKRSMTDNVSTSRRPGYRSVRIVDPSTAPEAAAALAMQRKRVYVLTFESFCNLLCVLCGFKQPNVFVSFDERLSTFLRRSLLRPLTHLVPGLAALMPSAQAAVTATVVPLASKMESSGAVEEGGQGTPKAKGDDSKRKVSSNSHNARRDGGHE